MDALAATEILIWHHYNGFPKKRWTAAGRLFQAHMWREYAMAWDDRPTRTGVGREWVKYVLRISRTECLRRARVNVYLARRLNRLGQQFKGKAIVR